MYLVMKMILDEFLEELEDMAIAEKRLASMKKNKEKLISMEEFEKEFNIDFDKIEPIDDEEIEKSV